MKRTPLKRKTALKRGNKPLKRYSRLKMRGSSDSSLLKEQIQAELRRIVIARDGGCFLRFYPESGACSGFTKDGVLILQAEHLHTRANSASYADPRLVVCICRHHHINWKPQFSDLYNELARDFIGTARAALWDRVKADRSPHQMDWKLELAALRSM